MSVHRVAVFKVLLCGLHCHTAVDAAIVECRGGQALLPELKGGHVLWCRSPLLAGRLDTEGPASDVVGAREGEEWKEPEDSSVVETVSKHDPGVL